jgi:hypothetical protein
MLKCAAVWVQDDNVAEIRAREKAVTGYLKVQHRHITIEGTQIHIVLFE